jgi:hypothetical protein
MKLPTISGNAITPNKSFDLEEFVIMLSAPV